MKKVLHYSMRTILLSGLFLFCPLVVDAATYTVVTNADTLSGSCGASCSLRDAVIASNAHAGSDTISIPAGTFTLNNFTTAGEDLAATGDLDITDTSGTLTITGSGSGTTIIHGNDTDRIFDIKANTTVVISGVTVTHGTVTDENGAGIANNGSLTLSNSIVSSNTLNANDADHFGVGIFCSTGTLNMSNVSVLDNYGVTSGGQFVYGAGVSIGSYDGSCATSIDESTLTNNTFNVGGGSIQFGGGLAVFQAAGKTVTVSDTTISHNTASAAGGVYVQGAAGVGVTTFDRVTINNNRSYGNGGGMNVDGNVKMVNVTIFGNQASSKGGGLYIENTTWADVFLYNATIIQNYSQVLGSSPQNGGGLYTSGVNAELSITGSVVAGNFRGAPSGSPVSDDCYEPASNNDAIAYSLLGNSTNCSFTTVTSTTVDPVSLSSVTSATLADNGGSVATVELIDGQITDIVAAANCLDQNGAALTVDARGFHRPDNTNCDIGAYELDQSAPGPVTSPSAVASGTTINLSWTNPVDSDFASVTIRRSTSSYPVSTSAGSAVGSSHTGTSYADTGLSDATYYYSFFAKDTSGHYSLAAQATATVDTVTQSPILTSPSTGGRQNSVNLRYTLPESPLNGTVVVTFVNTLTSNVVTFSMLNSTSVNITFDPKDSGNQVNLDNMSTIDTILPSAMPVLADGTYTVSLSYQDLLGNPASSAIATGVVIDTITQAPVITTPTAGGISNALQLVYTLPEAPAPGSIEVVLSDGSTTATLAMDTTQSMNTTLQLANLATTTHVNSASVTSLTDGTYSLSLEYQDLLGNPSVLTSVTGIVLDRVPPTLTLIGDASVSLTQGTAYVDQGAQSIDARQGDISSSIVVTNPVNVNVPGEYTVTYAVSDAAGNAASQITRRVTVVAAPTATPAPDSTEDPAPEPAVVDHGAVLRVRQSGASLNLTYADTTTATITPYGTSKNFRYALSTDKKRVIVTNGKDIRVFKNGTQVAKKTIGKTAYKNANYRIAVAKVYNSYDSVFVAAVKGKTARVYGMRLTTANALTKQQSQTFAVTNLTNPVLSVNKTKKQVTVAYGKSGKRVSKTWKLKTDGSFVLVR